jgi:hypothetical protein
MIRNFSALLPMIPASVWTEFSMALDYSIPMNAIADRMAAAMTDSELDEMIAMARSPAFQKHMELYPVFMDTMRDEIPVWLRSMRDSGDLVRLGHLMRKAGLDEELADMVVDSFNLAADVSDHDQTPGTGN